MKQCFTRTSADCKCTLSSFARHTWYSFTKTAIAIIATFLLFVTNANAQSATALNYDGTNDYVAVNNPYRTFNKEITVEFWMNTPSANMPFGSVMGQGTSNVDNMTNNVWLMHPNLNGTMTFYVNDAGTWRAAQCNIIAGSWHHYAGVASATSTKIYVDGALVYTGAGISNTILSNSGSVIHIGKDVRYNVGKPFDIPRYGNMSIDEVRIWNRALCQDEIVNNMNCQVNAQTGLQEVYHFNQTGTTLTDASGNGRDGALTNFALTGTISNWVVSGSTNTGTCTPYIAPTAPITGITTICIGTSTTLANANIGGTWSSSNTAVATINASSGLVNSVAQGTTTITYKTECGGVSTTTLTVGDIIPPTITCPANQVLNLDANCNATLPDYRSLVTASDNCTASNALVITQSPAAGTVVSTKGAQIITFTVTDASNNSSTCTITVDKKDVTAPVITCTASITVNNTANTCGAVVNYINPKATDNCTGGAFNFFTQGEPNNYPNIYNVGEDYIQLYTSGKWNDLPNYSLNRSLVEFNSIISTVFNGYSLIGTLGGHTYYYSTASATWTDSRAAAQAIGGDLASINTLQESTFLAPYGGNTWVGGYQDKSVPGFREPGDASQNFLGWKWVDGTSLGAGQIVITQTAGLPAGSVFPVGVTTNTFTATDESSNTSTCSFTVTVVDNQRPVINNCPADQTVTATSASGAVVNYTTPVGTDNCSGATTIRTVGLASGSTFPIGTTTVTHTVTDAAGLTASCSFTVKVSGLAPVIVCPANITVNNDPAQCSAIVSFAANETTGVPASTITYSKVPGSIFPVGTTTVTATATNAVGSSTCSFTVTVTAIDSDGDGIPDACDADADNDGIPNVLECNKSNFYWSNPPTVSGNTATGTINGIGYTYTSSSPIYTTTSMYAHSTFPLSYGVPNANPTIKNLAVTNNTITFASPMTNPVLVFASIGQGGVPVPITFGAPIEIVWSQNVVLNSPTQITGTEGYAIIRMMGTFSSINFNYQVAENWCNFAFGADFQTCGDKDNDGIPDYLDLDSDGDGCSDAIEGSMSFSVTQTSGGRLTGAVNSQGIPILAGNGQGVGTSQTYIVNCFCQPGLDETNPNAITKNITVNLDASGNATITASQVNDGSTDDCGIASMTVSTTNFTCSNIGVNTVTLTVTDNQGNVSSATAQVTVADNIKPVITSNGDKSVNNDPAKCGATVVVSATAKDNCGVDAPAGVRSDSKLLTDEYPVGTTTITWTVTDIHGNTNTTTQTVTVTDNEKPTISIAPVSANNDLGACSATVNIGTPVTGDNCGIASVVNNHASNIYPVGTTTITWTVTDIHGNTNTTTQSVTVTDNEKPTISIAPVSANNDLGACSATVNIGTPVTGDNCGVASVVNNHASNIYPVGTTTITWTVTDIHGNTNTTTQSITVTDNEKPTISIAPVSANNDLGACSATVNIGTPVTGDNCGVASVVNNHASNIYPVGTTTVIWTVTDIHGNQSTATQTITVTDNEVPTISSPVNIAVNNTAGICEATVNIGTPVTGDNCGVASVVNDHASNIYPVGTTTVTWTVTDIHGNTNTTTQTVTVTDNEKPMISIAPVSANNDLGVCSATVNIGTPTTGDNCGIASVVNDHASNDYPVGTTTVTWTVTDIHSNTNSITQLVTVTDNEKPVITNPSAQVNCANADGSTAYSIPAASATDNCGVASQSYAITGATTRGGTGYDASGVFNIGVSTIIWTVTDVHGNTGTGTTTVTINPLPVASYTTSNADAFCNQLTITASSSITPATYQWFSGSSTFANTQSISLGQTNGDGIYSVLVTDATTGCVSATAATYNFQKQTLASSYTILALEEVELGAYNKVNSGSVGVISAKGEAEFRSNSSVNSPGSFVKARKIESKGSNILITTPILSAATGITLPTMYYNTASTSGLPNKEVAKNSITTVSGNYKNLTLKKGSRTTLTGSVYGAIKVEQGAQVTFTQTTINIGKLHVVKGPRVGYSYVHFADGTKVLIGESVNIGSQVYINPDNNNVTFYLSNKKKGDHDEEGDGKGFMIHGGDTRVTANICMPGGKLKVKGGYGYGDYGKGKGDSDKEDDDEKDYGSGNSYVYMTGLFIAKEVESEGKNVIWNSFDCSSAPVPLVNTTTVAQSAGIKNTEQPTTEEELKVTVMPNPSSTYFTIKLESKYEMPVNMRVLDAGGRVIDAQSQIGSNSTFQVGHGYSSGTYYAELIQGSRRKVVQLVKARG